MMRRGMRLFRCNQGTHSYILFRSESNIINLHKWEIRSFTARIMNFLSTLRFKTQTPHVGLKLAVLWWLDFLGAAASSITNTTRVTNNVPFLRLALGGGKFQTALQTSCHLLEKTELSSFHSAFPSRGEVGHRRYRSKNRSN